MAIERTLSIIKPDGVEKNLVGKILDKFESNGLKIVTTKMVQLSKAQAEGFYAVHKGRGFFDELINYVRRGPVVITVLEGENAVSKHREIMGATDPAEAAEGTIRKEFGTDKGVNAVHGSDAVETAQEEIAYFFSKTELVN